MSFYLVKIAIHNTQKCQVDIMWLIIWLAIFFLLHVNNHDNLGESLLRGPWHEVVTGYFSFWYRQTQICSLGSGLGWDFESKMYRKVGILTVEYVLCHWCLCEHTRGYLTKKGLAVSIPTHFIHVSVRHLYHTVYRDLGEVINKYKTLAITPILSSS